VVDAVVDRNVPTLPPQLEREQGDTLTPPRALSSGDADAGAVLDQLQLQEVTQR
jgi:hypothetical protein